MGSRVTRNLSGFLVPGKQLTFENRDTSEISATENSPRPGDPIAGQADALLKPQIRGGQDTNVDVYVSKTGMPGTGDSAVRVIHKKDSATLWEGYNDPCGKFDYRLLKDHIAAQPLMDATVIPSTGKIIVIAAHETNAVGSDLESYTWDPTDNSWSRTTIVDNTTGAVNNFWRDVSITALPDESVIALVHSNTHPNNFFNMYLSKDDGATWTIYNEDVISVGSGVGTTAGGSRSDLVYSDPDVCWVRQHVGGVDTNILQYASTSQGAEFTLVNQWTTSASSTPTDINLLALPDGRLALIYRGASNFIYIRRVGSAWEPFEDATEETVQSAAYSAVAAHVDEDGTIYVYGTTVSDGNTYLYISRDLGDSFSFFGGVFTGVGSADTVDEMVSISSMGLHFVFGKMTASVGTNDNAISVWYGGGWGNGELVCEFGEGVATKVSGVMGYYELPHDMPTFNRGGSGGTWSLGQSGSFPVGYTQVTTALAADYEEWITGSGKVDMVAQGRVDITNGGSSTASHSIVRIQSGDGVSSLLQTELRFDNTNSRIRWIGNSSTTIEDISHNFGANDWIFKLYVNADTEEAFLWYRSADTLQWSMANSNSGFSLTPIASSTTSRFTFGHRVSTTSTTRYFHMEFYDGDDAGSIHCKTAQTDLLGKRLGSFGYPLPDIGPDNNIARLALLGGPGRITDSWDIDATADFPLSNLYPLRSPSPTATWRSQNTTEQIPLSWDNTYDTRWGNSVAIMVTGCNFPEAILEGQTGGGGWTTIATLDMDQDFNSLNFNRTGDMVFPRTTGALNQGGRFIWRNEFAGATIDLGNGDYRKIRRNTPGQWVLGSMANGKKPRIYIDGIDGTEDTTNGVCSIWVRSACAVVHNVSDYDQFRLRIPSGTNADGYWEMGAVLMGGLAVVGKQHDLGWQWRRDPNVETTTNRAGTSYARRLGRAPKSITVSYNSGYDLSNIRNNPDALVDFLAADTGNPLAAAEDVGHILAELLEELESGQIPTVFIPLVPNTDTVFTDPWDFLYCRVLGALQFDNVVGDEMEDEVYRTSPWTLQEII